MHEDEDYEELVRLLAPFRAMRIETGPVALSDEYLKMIEEVEAAPENQSGSDKTWVWRADRQYRDYFDRVEG